MYLKVVDKYGADQVVSAYVTPASSCPKSLERELQT